MVEVGQSSVFRTTGADALGCAPARTTCARAASFRIVSSTRSEAEATKQVPPTPQLDGAKNTRGGVPMILVSMAVSRCRIQGRLTSNWTKMTPSGRKCRRASRNDSSV